MTQHPDDKAAAELKELARKVGLKGYAPSDGESAADQSSAAAGDDDMIELARAVGLKGYTKPGDGS